MTTPIELEDAAENRKYDEYTQEAGGYGQNRANVDIAQRINHDGEVNRARYLPQNPTVIATKGPSKDVRLSFPICIWMYVFLFLYVYVCVCTGKVYVYIYVWSIFGV